MRDEERGALLHPSSLIPHPFKLRKEEVFLINDRIPDPDGASAFRSERLESDSLTRQGGRPEATTGSA
jgi:hypothetical protein